VYPVNPLQAARFASGLGIRAKSDPGDATPSLMWSAQSATSCARSPATATAPRRWKVRRRAHKTLIWERTRHLARLRHALLDFFPAALDAFDDLDAPDVLELLGKASTRTWPPG